MTTIAYDGKSLAADSRSCIGDMVYEEDCQKIFTDVGPFAVIGIAGDYQASMDVIDTIKDFLNIQHIRDIDFKALKWECVFIAVTDAGEVWYYRGDGSFTLRPDKAFAIGSGGPFALGAMGAGCTAEEAVKIAAQFDLYTNDTVVVANLVESKETDSLKGETK